MLALHYPLALKKNYLYLLKVDDPTREGTLAIKEQSYIDANEDEETQKRKKENIKDIHIQGKHFRTRFLSFLFFFFTFWWGDLIVFQRQASLLSVHYRLPVH